MELTILIEIVLKALVPLLVKEFYTLATTDIDDTIKDDLTVYSNSGSSIEALIDLNKSLKAETKFQREQIESLREMISRIQSRLPSEHDETE